MTVTQLDKRLSFESFSLQPVAVVSHLHACVDSYLHMQGSAKHVQGSVTHVRGSVMHIRASHYHVTFTLCLYTCSVVYTCCVLTSIGVFDYACFFHLWLLVVLRSRQRQLSVGMSFVDESC